MNTSSNTTVQAAVASSMTEAVVNSGDRAPVEIAGGVGGAVQQAQIDQSPQNLEQKQTVKKPKFKSAVDKWKQEFAKNMLRQPDGKRQQYIQEEHKKLVQQFNSDFAKAKNLDEAAKRRKFEAEAKLNALRQLIRDVNESNAKRNAASGTSKKERNYGKQVEKTVEEFAKSAPKSKNAKRKQSQKLTQLLLGDRPSELPRGPTGKEEPPVSSQPAKSDKSDSGTPSKSNKTLNTKSQETSKSEKKKVTIEKPKPKTTGQNVVKTKPVGGKQKKVKISSADRLFRLWKTQDCKEQIWRINFLDESVRKWLFDVYTKGSSLPGRQTEPCKLAEIFKRDSHDCGYDQYLQSVVPYPVKVDWLKSVIYKQNFISRSTIPFHDLLTNLIIQSLFLPLIGDNHENIDNPGWYVDLVANESFMMSDLRNEIFLGNMVEPALCNQHLVLSSPIGYNIQMLPALEAISDIYMITEREAFEQAYVLVMEHITDDQLDLKTLLRMTPCEIISKMKDLFSFIPSSEQSGDSECLDLSTDSEDPSDGLENCGSVGKEAEPSEPKHSNPPPESATLVKYVRPGPDIDPVEDKFQTIQLNSFTAFTDRLTSSTFVSKEVVVRTTVMPVALEDDVATKTRRSDESRCVFLTPTWTDGRKDDNIYAINLAHFYAIAGRLKVSSEEVDDCLKIAISSYSDTPYVMPHEARLTLTSPQMLILLKCVFRPLLRLATPTYEVSPCLPVRPSSDPIMKLRFSNFVDNVKAYQIVPDASVSLRFIPPSRRNISIAVGKRFNNAFNYAAFVWAYPGIYMFLKRLYSVNPYRVEFSHSRIFDYVQSLRLRKNLTVAQFVSYLKKAIEISDLLAADEMAVLRLLHYELWNNTKIFMKKELYSKDTTPRFIINPSPYVKIIYGCLIHQIESVLYEEDSPFKHMFIKHLSEEQVALELREFNDNCPPGYVFVSNDFNSFEGSQPRPAQSIAFSIFFSFTESNSLERYILNDVFYALTSYINIHGNGFDLLKCPGQMSGLESTSCGNGLLNVVNSLMVMLIYYLDIKAEGDDSMLRTTLLKALSLSAHSLFPCVSTTASSMFELSFCGRRLDLNGHIYATLEEELDKYVQFNTVLSSSIPNEQRLYDMGYMRLLSLGFRYPHHPLVSRCRDSFNNHFSKSGLQLSSKGVKQYERSNWWYLRERVPELSKLIKRWYNYPAKFPKMEEDDFNEIRTSTNPALRLSETMQFRSDKSLQKNQHLLVKMAGCAVTVGVVNVLVKNRYVKSVFNVLAAVGCSTYFSFKWAQQHWKSPNPIRLLVNHLKFTTPRVVKTVVDLENTCPSGLKLAPTNSLPKESCLYGFNFRPSSDCHPCEDDPDLSKLCPEDDYKTALNMIARSSHGQPVRIKQEQLAIFSEQYSPPDLSWMEWQTEDGLIPYEVEHHSYTEFYPSRIKERLSQNQRVFRSKAQQAERVVAAAHIRGKVVTSAISAVRYVKDILHNLSSKIKHRNEYQF